MAADNELATAYLALIPSLKGAKKTIEHELDAAGLEKVGEKEGEKLGDGASKSAGAKLKSGLGAAAKTAGAVAAAAFAGAFALGKQSLDSYADYEQLVGGVETLFKESSGQLQEYAAQAYKTAGLSANDYMEQATSFSASLIKSLGGDTSKAADYANMAITDMSDNSNKMGTSMEMIQNAYQGFAKQNYTMLDNLKLGYGGTKEEMQKLLDDATALSGIEYDIDSYADIVDAIHVIQTEMGITGTTAKEASDTIAGSIDSAKAAWANWLTGLADENADLPALTEQLVTSVETVIRNVAPRIGVIMASLGTVIHDELINMLSGCIEQLINNGPAMMEGAFGMFLNIVTAINEVITLAVDVLLLLLASLIAAIVSKGIEFFNAAGEVMAELARGIAEGVASVVDEIGRGIDACVQKVKDKIKDFIDAGKAIIGGIAEGIRNAVSSVTGAISDVLGKVRDFLPFSPAKKGPFSGKGWTLYSGLSMGEGLAEGLRMSAGLVEGEMQSLMQKASGVTANLNPTMATAAAGGGVVYNVYIDGARINDDPVIEGKFYDFLTELERLAIMEGGK